VLLSLSNTPAFRELEPERLRNRDRMYFIGCLTRTEGGFGEPANQFTGKAA
jgi:hypothetical protein